MISALIKQSFVFIFWGYFHLEEDILYFILVSKCNLSRFSFELFFWCNGKQLQGGVSGQRLFCLSFATPKKTVLFQVCTNLKKRNEDYTNHTQSWKKVVSRSASISCHINEAIFEQLEIVLNVFTEKGWCFFIQVFFFSIQFYFLTLWLLFIREKFFVW